jgi:hypothetical protein
MAQQSSSHLPYYAADTYCCFTSPITFFFGDKDSSTVNALQLCISTQALCH